MKFKKRDRIFLSATLSRIGEYIFSVIVLGVLISDKYRSQHLIIGLMIFIICELGAYFLNHSINNEEK